MASNMAQSINSATSGRDMTDRTRGSRDGEESPAIVFNYRLDDNVDRSEVESLSNYVPGGYHPLALGDVLGDGGRFRVVHKLGFGGYATVWLCHDTISKKWRAVKIMAAHASTPDCADLKALDLFSGIDPDTLAANHIQLALEHFWIDGPNGRHLCFVLPFLGPKLKHVFRSYGHVPDLMKDICFQLVGALKFIHSHGLCHGDFRPDNILFRLSDGVDEWEEAAIMKLLGEPGLARVKRTLDPEAEFEPGVPAYLVERADIIYGSGACSSDIAVIDFGVSYHAAQPPTGKGSGIPLPYAAPEELFEVDDLLGFGTDIWALGNTISEVRLGFTPFADEYDELPRAVKNMEVIIRPLPEPYRSVWKHWDCEFVNCPKEAGKLLDDDDDSWKDESVPATVNVEREQSVQQSRLREGRPGNYLHYRMHHADQLNISSEEATDVAAQAAANPRRLPAYEWDKPPLEYAERVQHVLEKSEMDQVFDLLLGIFQWRPEERATLDQIADHEWFGDRSRRNLAAVPVPFSAPEPTSNTKRARSASPLRPGKKPRHDDGANQTVECSGTVNNILVACSMYRARVASGLRKAAGWMMGFLSWSMGKIAKAVTGVITTTGWQDRRVDRRRN